MLQKDYRIFMLGGGFLAILNLIILLAFPSERSNLPVLVLILIGTILLGLGVIRLRNQNSFEWLMNALQRLATWLQVDSWQVIAIFLSVFFSITASLAAGDNPLMISPTVAWLAWLYSIAFAVLGWRKNSGFDLWSYKSAIFIAFIFLLLALPVRAISTATIPIVLTGDEASSGLQANLFVKGEENNPFKTGWYTFPNLYFLFPAAFISLLGNTTEALRISSAVIGALTVAITYLAGRYIFDKKTGFAAALLLTGFHFHIHFSRIGLNNIWDGFFFVATVLAAWVAWEKENRNAFIITGFGLGLAQYFYPSTRALILLVYGGMLLSGIFFHRDRLKRMIQNLIAMTSTMTIIILPLYVFYILFPAKFLAPIEKVSIFGKWMELEIERTGLTEWQIILKQLFFSAQAYVYRDLEFWYQPETPMLRPISAGLFLIGLLYLLISYKNYRSILVFLWLGVYVLIGGLSESTPAAQRYVGVAPVCMLIVAYGLRKILKEMEKLSFLNARWGAVLLMLIGALIAIDDSNFYFNQYTPLSVSQMGPLNGAVIAQELANDLLDEPKTTQVFFFSDGSMGYYSIPSISYLVPEIQGIDVVQPWGSPDNPAPTSDYLFFVFLGDKTDNLQKIQEIYPNGEQYEEKGIYSEHMYWVYKYSKNTSVNP